MSRRNQFKLGGALSVLFLILGIVLYAFSPPSNVPYTAAVYADRAKLVNSTGMDALGAYASPAACPLQVNLFSQNVVYSVPVLSLPGRASLGLNLTLVYNSKVWIKSGSTIYFDGDNGWPAVGWRLGFGRIDGLYTDASSVKHYYLISGDGHVRDLKYNATSGLYESYDSSYLDFDESTGILRHPDGTKVTYSSQGGYVVPTLIKDRNGNYITVNYSGTGQNISSIVDSVGRTTSFSYNGDGTLASISKSGFNNASRTWSFAYSNHTVTYSFNSLTVNGPTSGSQVKVLSSITFPNSTKQVFTYNAYAQLTEAAFKSSNDTQRGKVLVSWQSAPGGGWSDSPTPASVGNYDGTNTNTWSLSFGTYTTTVTDPASVARTTTFYQTGNWKDGLPDQTSSPSTAIRTDDTDWDHDGNSINPRRIRITTTLHEPDPDISSKVEYDYTTYGNISEVRQYDFGATLKRKTTTTYETGSNYTSRRILRLPLTVIVYDGGGTAKSRTEFTYDSGSLTSATGASNHDDTNYGTGFAYRGLATSVARYTNAVTPSGSITDTYTYDMLGNLRTESADCCVSRTFNYSSTTQFSQPDSIVSGSSGTTLTISQTIDSYTGLVASTTDENEKTTSYSYDVMDRPTSTTRSDSTVLSTSYDDSSATASMTTNTPIETSKSIKRKTEYDGLRRPTRAMALDASDNTFSKMDTVYDSVGRTWKTSNPFTGSSASYWTETQYDDIGRVTKVIPPDGSSSANRTVISYSGNVTTVTDPTGKQRKTKTDGLGRMVEVTEPDPANSDSLTLTTTYTYDPRGNVTEIAQGSQTRTWAFDGLGRETSETTPEAGTVSFTYNSDGHVTQRTDARGVVTSYTYDNLNRRTQISYNVSGTSATSTSTLSYTYGTSTSSNNKGRLTQMTDGVGEENYSYDSLGRRTQVQKKISNVTFTTSYTYNLASEVATITYPSGRVVKRNYDAIGRLSSVQNNSTSANYVSSIAYNAANEVTGFTYGNSVTASFGYSAERLQLTSLSYTQNSQTIFSLSYGYTQNNGNNGQKTQITDNVQSGRSVTYTYDSLKRLKTAVTNGSTPYPQWGLSWTYDRYGNRTQQSVTHGSGPSNSVAVSTSTNRITETGYTYDSNGNLTQDDLYKYKYDAENRLVELRLANDTLVATYTMDGNGLRVLKSASGLRTWYVYDGASLISEFEDSSSATYSSPTTPGQAPSDADSTLLYQHADHLTTRFTTDNSGMSGNLQAHYPYGEIWYNTGDADPSVSRKFTNYSREGEAATGKLNYAKFREHSGRVGRFLMADPVRGNAFNPQRLNRYAYGLGDPANRIDPNGLAVLGDDDPPGEGPCGGKECVFLGDPWGWDMFKSLEGNPYADLWRSGPIIRNPNLPPPPSANPGCYLVSRYLFSETYATSETVKSFERTGNFRCNSPTSCTSCECEYRKTIVTNTKITQTYQIQEKCPPSYQLSTRYARVTDPIGINTETTMYEWLPGAAINGVCLCIF